MSLIWSGRESEDACAEHQGEHRALPESRTERRIVHDLQHGIYVPGCIWCKDDRAADESEARRR